MVSRNSKDYKLEKVNIISNLRIVTMIPGDLRVAGCFCFSWEKLK